MDVVTARAVAPTAVLAEYAEPLLVDGGVLVAWKGRRDADEEHDAAAAAEVLGLDVEAAVPVAPRPGADERHLVVLRKVAPTPAGYPRRPGMARKRQLVCAFRPPNGHRPVTAAAADRRPRYLRPRMGTVYAIANQKGGVGKTTTAVNVAACIAEAGYPTLLVDVDPQANATVALGRSKHLDPNLYDVLRGEATADETIVPTEVEGLSLLPASPDLAASSVELPREGASEGRLRDALAPVRERFEYVLLDCPPALGPLTLNALVAADRVIVPVQTEYFALEGLAGLLDTLALVQRELNPRLAVAGML